MELSVTFYIKPRNVIVFGMCLMLVIAFYVYPPFRTDILGGRILNWIYPIPFLILAFIVLTKKLPEMTFRKEDFPNRKIGVFFECREREWIIGSAFFIFMGAIPAIFTQSKLGDMVMMMGFGLFFLPFFLILVSPIWKRRFRTP